ncbi:MAG: HAMP domain-containing protein, partial [bacterium]|nr:HAMP domain-containing protein [bacterium]
MPLPQNEVGDRPTRPGDAATPNETPPSREQSAWLAAVLAALLVPAAAALLHTGRIPLWVVLTLTFALGVGLATLCFWLLLYRPLSRAAAACRRIDSGNLNLTVPEKGPRPLRELAQVTNNTAADFQEVL